MDRLLRFDDLTRSSIENVIADIDTFSRGWKVQNRLDVNRLNELKHLATVRSVGSSTRIEGSSLSDQEIARLIEEMTIQELSTRDEQEVVGYYNTLEIIQAQFRDLRLSESLIKGLHNELLRQSAKDTHHRGAYKKQSNQVVATTAAGEQKLIFRLPAPH